MAAPSHFWIDSVLTEFSTPQFDIAYLLRKPEFVDTVCQIALQEWPKVCAEYGVHTAAEFRKEWVDTQDEEKEIPKGLVLIDKTSSKLAGFVFVEEDDLPTHRHIRPWMTTLYVLPEFRNKGGASALIKAAKAVAAVCGESKLYLYIENTTGTEGKALSHMYLARGFRIIEEGSFHGHPIAIMQCDLHASHPY